MAQLPRADSDERSEWPERPRADSDERSEWPERPRADSDERSEWPERPRADSDERSEWPSGRERRQMSTPSRSLGAVYDRGYRPYEGSLGGERTATFALYRTSIRRAL